MIDFAVALVIDFDFVVVTAPVIDFDFVVVIAPVINFVVALDFAYPAITRCRCS